MEQNLNFEYKGFKANGFVMLFVAFALAAASIWAIINAAIAGKDAIAVIAIH